MLIVQSPLFVVKLLPPVDPVNDKVVPAVELPIVIVLAFMLVPIAMSPAVPKSIATLPVVVDKIEIDVAIEVELIIDGV